VDAATENIKNILQKLKIYDVDSVGISAELKAYSQGFAPLFERAELLLADAFIQTASPESLKRRERLVRAVNTEVSVQALRNQLMARGIACGSFAKDMNAVFSACGVDGNIIENYCDGIYLNIDETDKSQLTRIISELCLFLPAHLPVYADLGGTSWGEIDSADIIYSEFDENDLSWDALDNR
jgi:hypothetical protein